MEAGIANKLLDLLSPAEKRQMALLAVVITLVAALDVVGVASIMPFMTMLATPELAEKSALLVAFRKLLGIQTNGEFLLALGFGVFCMLILGNAARTLSTWRQVSFCERTCHALASRLFASYLAQPYPFFLERNTATLGATILSDVGSAVNGVLRPAIEVVARVAVSLFIIGLLLAVDPFLTLVVAGSLGCAYAALYCSVRRRLARQGGQRIESNNLRYRYAAEALQGIKEIKILGREQAFLARFSKHSALFSELQTSFQVLSLLPSYALEVIAFGGIMLMVLHYLAIGQNLLSVLPVLALYALAARRLMPAFQEMFSSLANIRYNTPALLALHRDSCKLAPKPLAPAVADGGGKTLRLSRELRLEEIRYTYPGGTEPVLPGLSMRIAAGTQVALVGTTGSGKSTIADILLGLLIPEQGRISVDGVPIEAGNLSEWRRNLGYVPQQIYLADDSLRNNIALGIASDHINQADLERAARTAHLDQFIQTELPEGYNADIGERGVRLSGGQRQRIGIARALYHDPEVLILDEATSSLDNVTEQGVMAAIRGIGREKTVVIIAHRLSTVRHCDTIFLLDKGCIVAEGTFDELMSSCEAFRLLAKPQSTENAIPDALASA